MKWTFLLAILWTSNEDTLGARILAFVPMPAPSHFAVVAPIVRRLAELGHSVTAVTPYRLEDPPTNYNEILIPNNFPDIFKDINWSQVVDRFHLLEYISIFNLGLSLQESVCSVKEVRELIGSDLQFDVVLLEAYFGQESFAAFQHKFGAPVINFLACGDFLWGHELAGAPYNPAHTVDFNSPFTDRMTFPQRMVNTLNAYGGSLLGHLYYLPKVEAIMDKCFDYNGGDKRPPLSQLLSNTSLVLVNTHNSFNYPDPVASHFIEVGGINIRPNKPLPKDIQKFMDDAINGVIYFSLGSNIRVSAVAKDKVFQAFYTTFKKLKQRVLWKWEGLPFPNIPENIYISDWFPQQDILSHKNCLLFITHGGYLSLAEAVNFGVPVIGIPFFGDQPKNMKYVEEFGYGLQLNFNNISEESVGWAVKEVLKNTSYREAMKARSIIFRDRPMTPLDTAIYWIEYVIRHKGAPHLRPALADLPWYKSFLLDVAAFLAAVLAAVVFALYALAKSIVGLIVKRTTNLGSRKKFN